MATGNLRAPSAASSRRPPPPAARLLDSAVLLVNLSARRTRAHGWLNDARAQLADRFVLDVCFPRDVDESLATARLASAEGAVVIAAGGDGTMSVVAHGLSDMGGTLGVLPLGTANDFARALRVPSDPHAAVRLVQRGTVHRTDLVSMNGRHFTTVGGLGLVSRSTIDVARLRRSWARGLARMAGAGIYKIAAAGTMLQRRIVGGVRVTWRDPESGIEEMREIDVHGVFVTNHATCGGGLVIPTGARADDGVFELALIPATTRARLLVNLSRLSAGLPLAPGVLEVLRADRATIETEYEDVFVADGDTFETGRRFTLTAHKGAFGVLR